MPKDVPIGAITGAMAIKFNNNLDVPEKITVNVKGTVQGGFIVNPQGSTQGGFIVNPGGNAENKLWDRGLILNKEVLKLIQDPHKMLYGVMVLI